MTAEEGFNWEETRGFLSNSWEEVKMPPPQLFVVGKRATHIALTHVVAQSLCCKPRPADNNTDF
jgi:hypothetical protein